MARIHILGASGSGTSTLGAAVAAALAAPHFDTDNFYWLPTNPPFTTPRPSAERVALLSEKLAAHPDWVLSGSALKWGEPLAHLYDLVVFLIVDPELRMERLLRREKARYGHRIEPGGDMIGIHAAFMDWAASYDTAGPEQRSRAAHEAWLAARTAPVLRLDSSEPLETLRDAVLASTRAKT